VSEETEPEKLDDDVDVSNVESGSETESAPSVGAVDRVNPERSLELALAAAKTAAENGGTEVTVLDMSGHTAIFDYFVIATGASRRQLHAMSEEIDNTLEKDLDDKRVKRILMTNASISTATPPVAGSFWITARSSFTFLTKTPARSIRWRHYGLMRRRSI